MNAAAVRAVARMAFARHWEAVGIEAGYRGLLEGQFQPLSNRMVGVFCNGAGPYWEPPVRRSLRLPKVKNLRPGN